MDEQGGSGKGRKQKAFEFELLCWCGRTGSASPCIFPASGTSSGEGLEEQTRSAWVWLLIGAVCFLPLWARMEPVGWVPARVGGRQQEVAQGLGWQHPGCENPLGDALVCVMSSPFPSPPTAVPGAFVFKRKDFSFFPNGLNKG